MEPGDDLRTGPAARSSVRLSFDGRAVLARPGECVAAALLAAGITHLRDGPADGGPRGAFCFMGVCQECVVRIDGRMIESCRVTVQDGLVIERAG